MGTWATVEDVEARWVRTDENKVGTPTIQAWIDDAEQVVSHEFPDIADRIDAGDLPVERVRMVVCSMVLRVLRNPQNHRSLSTGPFSVTFAGDSPGGVWMTDEERAMLAPPEETSGAFSIDTVPTGGVVHAESCSINFGAEHCSCGAILTGLMPLYER